MTGRLLMFDALSTEFRELRLKRDPSCPMCGPDAPTSLDEIKYTDMTDASAGRRYLSDRMSADDAGNARLGTCDPAGAAGRRTESSGAASMARQRSLLSRLFAIEPFSRST